MMLCNWVNVLLVLYSSFCFGQEHVNSQTIDDILEDNARMKLEITKLAKLVEDTNNRVGKLETYVEQDSLYSHHCVYREEYEKLSTGDSWNVTFNQVLVSAGTGNMDPGTGVFTAGHAGEYMITISGIVQKGARGSCFNSIIVNGYQSGNSWQVDSYIGDNEDWWLEIPGSSTQIVHLEPGDTVMWTSSLGDASLYWPAMCIS